MWNLLEEKLLYKNLQELSDLKEKKYKRDPNKHYIRSLILLEQLPDTDIIPPLLRNPVCFNVEHKKYDGEINSQVIEIISTELRRIYKEFITVLNEDKDKEFLDKIVEKSLLVGTGRVYVNTVEYLIWEDYSEIQSDPELTENEKHVLTRLAHQLISLITGRNKILDKELAKISYEEKDDYRDQFRKMIEEKVKEIFSFDFNNENADESCDIIGDISE